GPVSARLAALAGHRLRYYGKNFRGKSEVRRGVFRGQHTKFDLHRRVLGPSTPANALPLAARVSAVLHERKCASLPAMPRPDSLRPNRFSRPWNTSSSKVTASFGDPARRPRICAAWGEGHN